MGLRSARERQQGNVESDRRSAYPVVTYPRQQDPKNKNKKREKHLKQPAAGEKTARPHGVGSWRK